MHLLVVKTFSLQNRLKDEDKQSSKRRARYSSMTGINPNLKPNSKRCLRIFRIALDVKLNPKHNTLHPEKNYCLGEKTYRPVLKSKG